MTFDVDAVLNRLTVAEKATLTVGQGAWSVPPLPGHGVPGLSLADGPHGVRKVLGADDPRGGGTAPATCFPTASLLGATWDPEVIRRVGEALGREARSAGVDVLLGPGVNIKRSPLCGRNFEYFSEDPFLSGVAGAAWIGGAQWAGVDACVKHFAVNNQEHRRFSIDAIVDERALREIYLPAFRTAVRAGAATVMSAYNRVNGTYATENPMLLTRVLREEWGFDGAVISDWGAVNDRAASLAAGMDLQMPGDGADRVAETVAAVQEGRLAEADLDRAARSVLRLIRRAEERRSAAPVAFDEDAHHHLGQLTASAGTVLLRNEAVDGRPVLPLGPRRQAPYRIALIGALAGEPRFQGSGSSRVVPTRVATLRSELRKRLPFSQIHYVPGYRRHDDVDSPPLRQVAVREAAEADVAVVVVGLPESHETEGLDRTRMDLPGPHDALVRAVAATNPRTVVVVVSGAPVTLPWRGEVAAILQAYLGGQAAGAAVADVLTGATDPGGRLAETFPAELDDHPAAALPNGPRQAEYRESLFVGYRWFDTADVPVAYPFGHGLSYTTFDWSDSALNRAEVTPEELREGRLEVSVTVTNTGTRPGSDVVQVYVERTDAGIFRPRRALAGFAKVHLLAGESERVTIAVDVAGFHHWDAAGGAFVVEDGAWRVHVSASAIEVRANHGVVTNGGVDPDCAPTCRAYRSLHPHHVFSRRAFEELLDEDLPDNVADRPGEFTENTPIGDALRSAAGRRLHDLVAGALARDMAGDGTVFAGDARDLAREVVPRMMLQGGLTPAMVRTVVDTLNGDWRAAARDGGAVVRALAGTRSERLRRLVRRR